MVRVDAHVGTFSHKPPTGAILLCTSRDCEFSLDFSKGVLEAHSLFEVSTVGDGGPGAPETLEIAQIKGTVCVDTPNQVRGCMCAAAASCGCWRWSRSFRPSPY